MLLTLCECRVHIAHCAGRGCRQADKARREAELEVEAAGRKLEALEVNIVNIVLIFLILLTKAIQEQLCRVQSKLRLSKQQAEDSELLVSASQARFLTNVTRCCTNDVLDMICQICQMELWALQAKHCDNCRCRRAEAEAQEAENRAGQVFCSNGVFFGRRHCCHSSSFSS